MNIGKQRSFQLLSDCWDIQTDLPLLLCHNFSIAWRSCKLRRNISAFLGISCCTD